MAISWPCLIIYMIFALFWDAFIAPAIPRFDYYKELGIVCYTLFVATVIKLYAAAWSRLWKAIFGMAKFKEQHAP